MVDANGSDEKFIEKLDKKTLPDSLKNKSTEEIEENSEIKKRTKGCHPKTNYSGKCRA